MICAQAGNLHMEKLNVEGAPLGVLPGDQVKLRGKPSSFKGLLGPHATNPNHGAMPFDVPEQSGRIAGA